MKVHIKATIRLPPHLMRDGIHPSSMSDELPIERIEGWVLAVMQSAEEHGAFDAGGSVEILVHRASMAVQH